MPLIATPTTARPAGLALLLCTGAAAVGCGSDDGDGAKSLGASDRVQISALVKRTLTSDAPGHTCRSFTPALVRTVYGTPAACTKAEKPDKNDADLKQVSISSVTGGATTATAAFTARGGTVEVRGGFGVVKRAGRWQIAQLRSDFLRSLIGAGLKRADLGEQGITSPGGRACVQKGVDGLSEAAVRRVAYAGIAERDGGEKDLVPALLRCQAQDPNGRRKLTATFVNGVTRSVRRKGAPARLSSCLQRDLPGRVRVADIVEQAIISRGGQGSPAAAQRLRAAVTAVATECGKASAGGRTT